MKTCLEDSSSEELMLSLFTIIKMLDNLRALYKGFCQSKMVLSDVCRTQKSSK